MAQRSLIIQADRDRMVRNYQSLLPYGRYLFEPRPLSVLCPQKILHTNTKGRLKARISASREKNETPESIAILVYNPKDKDRDTKNKGHRTLGKKAQPEEHIGKI